MPSAQELTAIWRCFFHMRANWLRPLLTGFVAARSCCRKCGLSRLGYTTARGTNFTAGFSTYDVVRVLRATHL